MAMTASRSPRAGPLTLVTATVVLQLVAAGVLGYAAAAHANIALAAIAILFAIGLHLLRFVIWGFAHRFFPLSQSYPLAALFFPCVLALSYFKGDSINNEQVIGTILITVGAFVMTPPKQTSGHDSD